MMKIKTLAEILAESGSDSASRAEGRERQSRAPSKRAQQGASATATQPSRRPKRQSNRLTSPLTSHSLPDAPLIMPPNPQTGVQPSATDSASKAASDDDRDRPTSQNSKRPSRAQKRKRNPRFHPAAPYRAVSTTASYQPPDRHSIKQILSEASAETSTEASHDVSDTASQTGASTGVDDDSADNLPAALKAYLRTPEERQAEIDALKADSRLRWLAFYYLSRREYGKSELKQKLIAKDQDPKKIDELLDEFETKGYQSDYRTALMLIRENIRKGRGRGRIKQAFFHKKIAMPSNIDELIDMANSESEEFIDVMDNDTDSLVDGVDWLKLAVTARTKKYGDTIPTEPKDKARQLRFLQYRGFKSEVCFAALNHTLATLDERF